MKDVVAATSTVEERRFLWCGFATNRADPLSIHGMQPMTASIVDGVEMYTCPLEHDNQTGAGSPGRWLPGSSIAAYMRARGLWAMTAGPLGPVE